MRRPDPPTDFAEPWSGLTNTLPERSKTRERHTPDEAADHALGRSRGGLSTKVHLAADGHARPLAFTVPAGQAGHTIRQALDRLPGRAPPRGHLDLGSTLTKKQNLAVNNRVWWKGWSPVRRQQCPRTVFQPLSEFDRPGASDVVQGERDDPVTGSPSVPPHCASERAGQCQQGGEAAPVLLDDDRTGRLQVLEPVGLVDPGTPSCPIRGVILERLSLRLTHHQFFVGLRIGVRVRKGNGQQPAPPLIVPGPPPTTPGPLKPGKRPARAHLAQIGPIFLGKGHTEFPFGLDDLDFSEGDSVMGRA